MDLLQGFQFLFAMENPQMQVLFGELAVKSALIFKSLQPGSENPQCVVLCAAPKQNDLTYTPPAPRRTKNCQ